MSRPRKPRRRLGEVLRSWRQAVVTGVVKFSDTPFAELLTWVGTVFGGVIVSGSGGNGWIILFGAFIVLVAVLPLAIQGTLQWRSRRLDEVLDGRELVAKDFAMEAIQTAADWEESKRDVRVDMADAHIADALDSIFEAYFSGNPDVRVVLYSLSSDNASLRYVEQRGRRDSPRDFNAEEDTRGATAVARLNDPDEHFFCPDTSLLPPEWSATDRSYAAFISLPIRSSQRGYGMLTVDSAVPNVLYERDAVALETYASAMAFYLAAARRGAHTRKKEGEADDDQQPALGPEDGGGALSRPPGESTQDGDGADARDSSGADVGTGEKY